MATNSIEMLKILMTSAAAATRGEREF